MPTWDSLWINGHLATMTPGAAPYGAIEDGALAVAGRPHRLGRRRGRPAGTATPARESHDRRRLADARA